MSSPLRTPTRIAVVTVSYGSAEVLGGFLASIPAAADGPVGVTVADNKPAANVRAEAEAAGARYLPQSKNSGYGGAMNAAIATLAPEIDWVLISNPDVVLHPDSVATLVSRGDSDHGIGAVGPAILTATGELYPSARSVPSLRTGIGHALFANFWVSNPWSRAYRNDQTAASSSRDAGWLSGACLLVRRTAFDAVGGFDPDFFMYFEDVDLGYRLGLANYRNVYEPKAVVTHTGAHSTGTDSAAMIRAHHDSARLFLAKKYSGALLAPVRFALTLSLGIRSAVIRHRLHD
ncbi:MAG: glycosyltransferase family 2 protein [Microbacteriaceae bacterium]|nr:glycosyltransferase family 2 protein [Microbacteriaceae bacterium]